MYAFLCAGRNVSAHTAFHISRCARAEQGLKRCEWINNGIDRRTVWRGAVEPGGWLPAVRLRGLQLVRFCMRPCVWLPRRELWRRREYSPGALVISTSNSLTSWVFWHHTYHHHHRHQLLLVLVFLLFVPVLLVVPFNIVFVLVLIVRVVVVVVVVVVLLLLLFFFCSSCFSSYYYCSSSSDSSSFSSSSFFFFFFFLFFLTI